MKFNKLRLSGFKSFVDPTELHIEPGLTGVVGPNGCGKSNLLEALRWVMGETSAKSMRGRGMEDVIFAGTNQRPSRNWAEVVLHLDNADRSAPAAFNEHESLEVSRRIERDAGSNYRVNGKEVRARDVQLLFADLSSGAHSPSLVRQGQIGQLISAKPKDRRMILEEAAGISGLHSRRHEAELRLRAAEQNLTRVDDVIQQIEEQLSGLKRQARQASRYRNLSGHIRSAEAIVLHLKWTAAKDAAEAAETRLKEVQARVAELTEATASTSKAQFEANAKLQPLRDEEAEAAAALHRLSVERDTLETEEKRARQEAERLTARIAQVESDLGREKTLVGEGEDALARLAAEKTALEAASEGQDEAQAQAQEALDGTAAALTDAEAALDALNEELAKLRAKRSSLERTVEQARARAEKTRRQLAQAVEERERLEAAARDSARVEEAQSAFDAAAEAQTAAEAEAERTERAHGDAREAERAARQPLQDADKIVGELKAEAGALAKLLNVANQDLFAPLIESIQVAPGYETALGAALGDDLDVPLDEAAPVHWRDLGPAAEDAALPEGVTPLSDHVTAPPALERRLSRIGLVDAKDGTRLHTALAPGQRLVTKDGAVWRWDGLSAAADAPTAAAIRLSQKNRLADLEAEIADAEKIAARARETFHEARLAAEEAGQAEQAARRALRDRQSEAARAREGLAQAEREAAKHSSRLAALAESEQLHGRDLEEAETTLAQAEADLAALPEEGRTTAELADLRERVSALRLEQSERRAALDGLKREAEGRRRRLDDVRREAEGWTKRRENSAAQIESLETRAQEARTELLEAEAVPGRLEERRARLLDAIAEAEEKRQRAADALAEAEGSLGDADKANKRAVEDLAAARETRAREEATLEAAEERIEEVRERIRDALDCAPGAVLSFADVKEGQDLPPLDEIEKKLDRLKRERENMGAVNLRADEEMSEASEKLDTLQSEREDLEQAIARLRQAIGSLNKEGRERLLEAYTTVSENFERLFTALFGGGTAKLELVESDDPLEAGLDILARPPGKKLQNMTLLSGGEQALTAMALIFAVFLANPAPICVLDEVDAPLDDANVERFCDLLDEMNNLTDTRFLVITHHPVTMARMNRLFGVTMAERGVSQLVSVDLMAAQKLQAAE